VPKTLFVCQGTKTGLVITRISFTPEKTDNESSLRNIGLHRLPTHISHTIMTTTFTISAKTSNISFFIYIFFFI